jgi:predicted type IV restriction endonuclease
MASIPKRVIDRFIKQTPKFQRVIKNASDRDVNEADTVKIVADILSEVFGFDRYREITSEYAIRNTYCDLAVKINDNVKYLIEVKSISIELKEAHLRQAINYGANEGIQWVILTNGLVWQVYNIRLKQSIVSNKILELNFLDLNPRKKEDQEQLFLLAKEGLSKDVISEYHERVKCVNRFVISSILLNKFGLDLIKRELRRLSPGLKIENSEIESILNNDIIKRNVIEDDEFIEAQKKVKRSVTKHTK